MQDYFFIWGDGFYNRFFHSEITYIESLKNYIRIITNKKPYVVLATMKRVEEILPKNEFCRIHRRYIVSLAAIVRFNKNGVWIGDKRLPISETYRKMFFKKVVSLNHESKSHSKITDNGTDIFLKTLIKAEGIFSA